LFLRVVEVDLSPECDLDLHLNGLKTRFLPLSVRLIILASARNRKLLVDVDK
jgi:hypothetical protein